MPEPFRSPPDRTQTETPGESALDPTRVRPEGSITLPPLRPEVDFGPPEADGDLGKLGRFRVLKKLGAGGMGAVYLGADTVLARRVALKVMLPQVAADPEAKERFVREACTAALVRSDHVVTIFDVGEDRGVPFIAMEYLSGYPLDRFLREQGHPSLANVVRIGRETALGLAAAHKLGLIHRDVKPGNIWLEAPKGRVKILDFGLARVADDDAELTTPGQIVGTPAYMSPEQARNAKLDPRSDLFSLGVMLYRLATGRMPFEGNTTMALLTSLAVDTPVPPRQLKPTISPGLEAVIGKLLAKDPADRYQSAREAADALAELERLRQAEQSAADLPMAIPVQPEPASFEVVGGPKDDSGSRARLITEVVDARPAGPRAARKKPARKKAGGRPGWVVPAVAAAACAALAGLALSLWPAKGTLVVESDDPEAELVIRRDGAVVRDRTRERELRLRAGAYTVELAEPRPGLKLTPERFEVTTREPARVRVAAVPVPVPVPPPPPPPPADERAIAEWVLSVRGAVRVVGDNGGERRADRGLPPGPIRITRINLTGTGQATVDGLARFRRCTALTELCLVGCPELTDAALAAFREHTALQGFAVDDCTKVTGAGLVYFKGCRGLDHISAARCLELNDDALAHFRECAGLAFLNLTGCPKVTNTGLAYFKGCKGLKTLLLSGTGVDDAGLAEMKGCAELRVLDVPDAATRPRTTELSWSLPRCLIRHKDWKLEVDPDRRAAQYALHVGGIVTVRAGGKAHECVGPDAVLPPGPLELTTFNVSRQARATDAGLIVVTGCRHIRFLFLNESGVTDAGLAYFVGLTTVERIDAYQTRISDRGLSVFRNCKDLNYLDVSGTDVTGVALADFAGCPKLDQLRLAGCPYLTDAGLAGLAGFPALKLLDLTGAPVSDAGLEPLKGCKGLTELRVRRTRATPAQVAEFRAAVPGCTVQYDGPPAADPDRAAAEWVVSVGGRVRVSGLPGEVSEPGRLPKKSFQVTRVDLGGGRVTDAGLAKLKGCVGLAALDVRQSPVTEAGLAALKDCRSLSTLVLAYCDGVTDAALAHFKDCKRLTNLQMFGCKQVTDAGLAHFKGCTELTHLNLGYDDRATDAGLGHFAGCANLVYLNVHGCKRVTDAGLLLFQNCRQLTELKAEDCPEVTDAGVRPFLECKALGGLYMRGTKVSRALAEEFRRALPRCKIEYAAGALDPPK